MKELIGSVIKGAAEQMRGFEASQRGGPEAGALPARGQLVRYLAEHRGDPEAIIRFAMAKAPPGTDVLAEALRYEERMEALHNRLRENR